MKEIILGAGLSGLGIAKENPSLKIYEERESGIGHASSYIRFNQFFDHGAHICHSKNEQWLKLLDLDNVTINKSKIMSYKSGNWIGYPVQNNICDLDIKEAQEVVQGLLDRGEEKPLENYYDWLLISYGKYLADMYYSIYTQKYWRTDPREMSIDWLNGRLVKPDSKKIAHGIFSNSEQQAVFSEYIYPRQGGFEALFSRILAKYKDQIYYGYKVTEIDIYKRNVIFASEKVEGYEKIYSTLPLPTLLGLIGKNTKLPLAVSDALGNLKYLNLIQTVVQFKLEKEVDLEDCPDWFYVYDIEIDFSRAALMNKLRGERKAKILYFQIETFIRNDEDVCLNNVLDNIKLELPFIVQSMVKCNILDASYYIDNLGISYVVPLKNNSKYLEIIKSYLAENNIETLGLYGHWKYVWSDAAFLNSSSGKWR